MDITLIKIGTKLELEIINRLQEKTGQIYVSQLIDAVDEKHILISAPIHESKIVFMANETRIRIVFLHDKLGLLSFIGSISSKERRDNLVLFHTNIESRIEQIQRRQYYRHECILNALYRVCQNPDESVSTDFEELEIPFKNALSKNLSGNGASIISDEYLPVGTHIELNLYLSSELKVNVKCKIIRSTLLENTKGKKYDFGLYFKAISAKDQEHLVRFIFDQQRQSLKKSKG